MSMIPDDELENIKRNTDLVGLCPFHEDKNPRLHITPAKQLTISTIVHEGGRIVVRPLLVTGPFRLFVMDGPELPSELLERLIFLPNEPEDSPCP